MVINIIHDCGNTRIEVLRYGAQLSHGQYQKLYQRAAKKGQVAGLFVLIFVDHGPQKLQYASVVILKKIKLDP